MRPALAASPGLFISSVSICVSTERVILLGGNIAGRELRIIVTKAGQFREDKLLKTTEGGTNNSIQAGVTLNPLLKKTKKGLCVLHVFINTDFLF